MDCRVRRASTALQQNDEVPRADGAAGLEGDVVTVATRGGRMVWSPRCAFCGASAAPAQGLCSCGAEYLYDGWWWIPDANGEIG